MRKSIDSARVIRFIVLRLAIFLFWGGELVGAPRRSQTIVTFPEEREFTYTYEPAEKALVLEFKKTHPDELKAIYEYDDSIVRRVMVKDLGGQGSEVKLILKDDKIRVLVNTYKEPYRVAIDFFDPDYRQAADPATGLPITQIAAIDSSKDKNHDEQGSGEGSIRASLPEKPVLQLRAQQTPKIEASIPSSPSQSPSSALKLMIPKTDSGIKTAQDLLEKVQSLPEGQGNAWKTYPPYIYRLQTSQWKSGKNYDAWLKQNTTQAMSSHEAMANYAGQLFDFGHEHRALAVYQKILGENPSIFEKNPEALWKLAELQLGQGNFSLAQGYYDAFLEKHPDSPLAGLAHLRKLDLKAIRANLSQKPEDIASLKNDMTTLPRTPSTQALIALRAAYWGIGKDEIKAMLPDYRKLPKIDLDIANGIEQAKASSDGARTSFLMDSILFSHKIESNPWNSETAIFAGNYFERYHGRATEPYRTQLLEKSEASLLKTIDHSLKNQQYTEIAAIIESLPKSLEVLKSRSNVSWAAAEAYRRLQQPGLAIPYYEKALASAQLKPNQFRAAFWLEQSLIQNQGMLSVKGQSQKQSLSSKLKKADQSVWDTWKSLKAEEKPQIFAEVQPEIEDNVRSSIAVKSSPKILLEILGQDLATTVSTASNPTNSVNESTEVQGPSVKMIYLLSDLSKRFAEQGLAGEARKAKQLLRRLDMKALKADKDALAIWTSELTKLAEDYREGNDYLEAGRIYALTGKSNNQWEGRAEALYKGGLLLFRAGRKNEAMEAFQEAASDGGNQLYADLAKKRLEQLK